MLHHLVGGSWGLVIRRPLESGAMNVLPLAVLFVPIAFGVQSLYPWARAASAGHEAALEHSSYLTESFFLIRAVALLRDLDRDGADRQWAVEPARRPTAIPHPAAGFRRSPGRESCLLFLAGTFSAIDWGMSLDPKWTSTIYGVMIIIADALATMALMIVVTGFLAADRPMSEIATPGRLNDLGNLLLAFVMLWAYMSFCQFLIIWSGNLTEEIPWYLRRTRGGWQWVALALDRVQLLPAVLRALVPREQAQDREGVARGPLDPLHALGQPGLAGHSGLDRPGQPADCSGSRFS